MKERGLNIQSLFWLLLGFFLAIFGLMLGQKLNRAERKDAIKPKSKTDSQPESITENTAPIGALDSDGIHKSSEEQLGSETPEPKIKLRLVAE